MIAGTRSINLVLSTYLPDPDDGKVSVASARLEGMCGFLTLPVSHPFIMKDKDVIDQVDEVATIYERRLRSDYFSLFFTNKLILLFLDLKLLV